MELTLSKEEKILLLFASLHGELFVSFLFGKLPGPMRCFVCLTEYYVHQ